MLHHQTMTYRGYTLDAFQQEAIEALDAGESVLVSAPTGTGKTLIADYLTEATFKANRQVVYTAPIKALSNQKFKEFKALLGEEHVGILTGDIVVNPQATVLIMTTEIFRNLLHTDRERLEPVSHVIFDEIHYIDDPARGSVWEESLIFMPPQMRFLGLSATIPNIGELARWIERIQGRPVRVVTHSVRAVPLEHRLFEHTLGECTLKRLEKRYRRYAARFGTTSSGTVAAKFEVTRHIDLVKHIAPDLLPCLFFTFSRRKCEINAKELAEHFRWTDAREEEQVREVAERTLQRYEGAGERSLREILPLLLKGIAYHHAGLLPVVKDVVEELFERRLIKVLYCTETFAVGLNFPCRTVCFDAVTKWDGSRFRSLTNREYFQMAGRAGRRGIDEKGYVFTAVDFNFFNPREFPSMREDEVEPIESRFTLSYNTVLNLVKNYDRPQIESILNRNFASFQMDEAKRRYRQELRRLEKEQRELLGDLSPRDAESALEFFERERALARLENQLYRKEALGERRGLKALRREIRGHQQALRQLEQHGLSAQMRERFRGKVKAYRRVTWRAWSGWKNSWPSCRRRTLLSTSLKISWRCWRRWTTCAKGSSPPAASLRPRSTAASCWSPNCFFAGCSMIGTNTRSMPWPLPWITSLAKERTAAATRHLTRVWSSGPPSLSARWNGSIWATRPSSFTTTWPKRLPCGAAAPRLATWSRPAAPTKETSSLPFGGPSMCCGRCVKPPSRTNFWLRNCLTASNSWTGTRYRSSFDVARDQRWRLRAI